MRQITASHLTIQAAGIKAIGAVLAGPDHVGQRCAVCGADINPGDPIDKLDLPRTFTNQSSLAIPNGKWRCGACNAIMGNSEFQMGASTILVCSDGVFPIVRKEHRAWAFLTPPEPPFVIAIQNAKQQHVIWRAPVSLSKDLIMVRLGEQIFRLRRQKLLNCVEIAKRIDAARITPGRPVKDAIENPFVNDWKFQSAEGGRLKSWVWKLQAEQKIAPEDFVELTTLNGGEAWALTAFLSATITKPDPLNF